MSEAVNEDAKAETAEDDMVPKGCILYSTSTSVGGHEELRQCPEPPFFLYSARPLSPLGHLPRRNAPPVNIFWKIPANTC